MFNFHPETNDAVKAILNTLYQTKVRCRIFYGDVETGKAWPEEYDTTGRIGRSTGSVKVPLLVNNARSIGGCAILDHCILAIFLTDGQLMYKHPTFDVGQWNIKPADIPEYTHSVYLNDIIHARFKSKKQAYNYVDFMTGKRFCK